MSRVVFRPAGFEAEVSAPTPLIDVTDRYPEAKVPYSCRNASCGTCRVRVLQGAEGLSEPEDDELEVLEVFDNEPGVRLCCQIRLEKDVPALELEVVEPE